MDHPDPGARAFGGGERTRRSPVSGPYPIPAPAAERPRPAALVLPCHRLCPEAPALPSRVFPCSLSPHHPSASPQRPLASHPHLRTPPWLPEAPSPPRHSGSLWVLTPLPSPGRVLGSLSTPIPHSGSAGSPAPPRLSPGSPAIPDSSLGLVPSLPEATTSSRPRFSLDPSRSPWGVRGRLCCPTALRTLETYPFPRTRPSLRRHPHSHPPHQRDRVPHFLLSA